VLPLAQATLDTDDPASRKLTVWVYGDGGRAATLFEDDGSWSPALDMVQLDWDSATKTGRILRSSPSLTNAYEVLSWKQIQ
jgi:hypothetical protein